MAATPPTPVTSSVPILLLKTKSSPSDAYEELLARSISPQGVGFDPVFVPVLEHCFDAGGAARLRELLIHRKVCQGRGDADESYGGLIFTSQRAVEAFAKVVADGDGRDSAGAGAGAGAGAEPETATAWPHLHGVPIYSVGPATTRALRAVPNLSPLQVFGDHTGNGEDLAYFIREHYIGLQDAPAPERLAKRAAPRIPPLLFLVGEKRRDILPKVLMGGAEDGDASNTSLRIQVDEVVLYGTSVMASFTHDLQRQLTATRDRPFRWAVVFSPTGCGDLLSNLGLLDPATRRVAVSKTHEDGRRQPHASRTVFVAAIGPTTRAYLQKTFGFEPDVCADEPSPEGVLRGISRFMAALPVSR